MDFDTTVTSPSRPGGPPGACRLLVLHSPSAEQVGRSVVLGAAAVEIGRATETLSLPDAELSRRHAIVERQNDLVSYVLRDLGSRNGTFVNGARCDTRTLEAEDVIRVGTHLLLYQYLSLEACEALASGSPSDAVLVGKSWPMVALRAAIAEIAPTGRPVLVLGETGAGKELVAQALHRQSGRAGAFVPVNCAALPEQLAESELFGYARGAFTGAREPSEGLFGAADGGTLFLDEIGEIAPPLQAKLLRALATGEVRRVGETQARHVDARIVAATNADLAEAIEDGAFRGDLYARLHGTVLRAPPLRERREDVLALVAHFLRVEDAEVGVHVDAAETLLVHAWPFNVRELEQVIRSAAPKARAAGLLEPRHLPASFALRVSDAQEVAPAEAPIALRVARDRMPTGPELELVLRHFDGNIARVAEYFARDRKQIYRWAQRLGVGLGEFRG